MFTLNLTADELYTLCYTLSQRAYRIEDLIHSIKGDDDISIDLRSRLFFTLKNLNSIHDKAWDVMREWGEDNVK